MILTPSSSFFVFVFFFFFLSFYSLLPAMTVSFLF
jgi:hypothetical protein